MLNMQLLTKKSGEEILRLLFDVDLKKASSSRGLGIVNENAPNEWNDISELRLFSKVVYFKPAGVNRNFNLGQLANYMNNIYEDEEHTDFEVFLTPEDFKLYQKRRDLTNKADIIIFKPVYKIRPTPEMIMAKLGEMYNMETVENHEYLPDCFLEQKDFEFFMDLFQKGKTCSVSSKDANKSMSTPVPPKGAKREIPSRSGSPSLATIAINLAAKKRKAFAMDNSRDSSPASKR